MSNKVAAGLAIVFVLLLCIVGAIGLATVYMATGPTHPAYPQAYYATSTASTQQTSTAPRPPATKRPPASSTPRLPQYRLALLAMRGHQSEGGAYFVVEGQVQNLSSAPMENIVAVATVYDSAHSFITYDEALIDYTTLLPQQVSPFSVMVDYNPSIKFYDLVFTSIGGESVAYQDNRPEASPDGAFLTCAHEVMSLMDQVAPTLEEQIDYAIADPEAGRIVCSFLPIWRDAFITAFDQYEHCGKPSDPGLQQAAQAMTRYRGNLDIALSRVEGFCGLTGPVVGGLPAARADMTRAKSAAGEAWGILLSYESGN